MVIYATNRVMFGDLTRKKCSKIGIYQKKKAERISDWALNHPSKSKKSKAESSPIEHLDAPSQNGHHKLFGNDALKLGDSASSIDNGCEQWPVNSLFPSTTSADKGKCLNLCPKNIPRSP